MFIILYLIEHQIIGSRSRFVFVGHLFFIRVNFILFNANYHCFQNSGLCFFLFADFSWYRCIIYDKIWYWNKWQCIAFHDIFRVTRNLDKWHEMTGFSFFFFLFSSFYFSCATIYVKIHHCYGVKMMENKKCYEIHEIFIDWNKFHFRQILRLCFSECFMEIADWYEKFCNSVIYLSCLREILDKLKIFDFPNDRCDVSHYELWNIL